MDDNNKRPQPGTKPDAPGFSPDTLSSGTRKIYVASSWRNGFQPEVVARLRSEGHWVYDFKGSGDGWGSNGHGPGGFGWHEIDNDWKNWITDIPRYLERLNHPRAVEGFARDMNALRLSDACVMVMPCGPSASMEMGWACGSGRPTFVYIPEMREPDLMVKMADLVTDNLDSIVRSLSNCLKARTPKAEAQGSAEKSANV